jgi:hypothetical protein
MEAQLACPHNIPKKSFGPGIAKPTGKKALNILMMEQCEGSNKGT